MQSLPARRGTTLSWPCVASGGKRRPATRRALPQSPWRLTYLPRAPQVVEPPPRETSLSVLGGFLENRLPDHLDLAMAIVVIASLSIALYNWSFGLTSQLLAASIVAPALCFLLVSRSLRRCQGVGWERMFIAAAALAAGIWLFELVNYLGWTDSWKVIGRSLWTFGLGLPRHGGPFPILWAFMLLATVFVGARHMRANRWFWLAAGATAAWVLLWIAVGYPSFYEPRRWPDTGPLLQLIPTEFSHPRDPAAPGWMDISGWGGLFTTGAKLLIGTLPATLFVHHLARAGASAPPDDFLARSWRALRSRGRPGAVRRSRGGGSAFDRASRRLAARAAPLTDRAAKLRAFIAPKLSDLADLFMVGVIAVAAAIAVVNQSFFLSGDLLAGSIIGYALCFLLASRSLRGNGDLGFERAFISLCAMVSAIWLFEFVFHYWGWDGYRYFWQGFPTLFLTASGEPFAFTWSIIMLSLVFVGRRYLRINQYFLTVLTIAVALTWMWKMAGFPTFKSPELWPRFPPPLLPVIPIEYSHAPTKQAEDTIVFWGLVFNTVAKVAWCVLPATLFMTPENLGAPLRVRMWPPGPPLRRLLMPWTEWKAAPERSVSSARRHRRSRSAARRRSRRGRS